MTPGNPLTQAPTAAELLADPVVVQAMEQAWIDSLPGDPGQRHEEGGWIYQDVTSGSITTRRAPSGTQRRLGLGGPPVIGGAVVVGTFHTHPNPRADGWLLGPSGTDQASAQLTGVPWLIRAEDGYHWTGPSSRRGGLGGGPGFPP